MSDPEGNYYTTKQAQQLTGLTTGRLRQMLGSGELEGIPPNESETRSWLIPAREVIRLRKERREKREGAPLGLPDEDLPAPATSQIPADLLSLIDDLRTLERERGAMERQIELTEKTESTLQDELRRERERADNLQAELERERGLTLWQRLFGGRNPNP